MLSKDKNGREYIATMTKEEIVKWAFELSEENHWLNAALDDIISRIGDKNIDDPTVQDDKRDLVDKVKGENGMKLEGANVDIDKEIDKALWPYTWRFRRLWWKILRIINQVKEEGV